MTCRSLVRFGIFSIETFDRVPQVNPSYFKGAPLSNQEFVFDISFDATRDVAKSQVKRLSKSQLVEYSYEVFLFGLATLAGG